MERQKRESLWLAALLGTTLLLWAAALCDLFRITNVFLWFLLKRFPGPWIVFGAMLVCPLAAAILGWRMSRAEPRRWLGYLGGVLGALLVIAWCATIGHAHLMKMVGPKTPKNPAIPRPLEPQTGLEVFPGAEGYGTRTLAGRGGKVIEVTSLADSGPGSLRAALEDSSPRIIVFRVGGTIELRRHLFISHPFVTVAGQTAPGDGICLKHAGLVIITHDVLVQHLRVRPGNEGKVDADTNDAIQVLGKHGRASGAYNVVLDHLSASWGEDETVSTWFGAHDITLSWCIISEALNRSRHRKRTHSAGLLVGDSSYHVSIHHCVLAHNGFRNPLINGGGTHDVVNNVIYNWGEIPAEIVDNDSNSFLNFVGNYFRPGPSTQSVPFDIVINSEGGTPQIYVQGNIGAKRPMPAISEWALVSHGWGERPAPEKYRSHNRFPTPPVTTWTAEAGLEKVLAGAGATRPQRDPVDQRVVGDVQNRTGRIIDSPKDVGGYPKLKGGTPPADSDHDGLPDDWERPRGLNPEDASDGNRDRDGDGYTNIEEYLQSLARP